MIARLRTREEWRFFAVLHVAHRGLAATWWALIAARGALPAVFTITVGVLVGAIGQARPLILPLIAMGAVFIVIQVLAPLHAQVGANLGDHLSAWLHGRLLDATTGPAGIAHLESPDVTDDLTAARDFDLGRAGPPMSMSIGIIAGGLVEFIAGVAQALVLVAYRWWAPLLVAGAWASTHWLLRESTVWDRDAGEVLSAGRRAEYTYRLAVDSPAAKEMRIFGLSEWTVAQFAASRRRLVDLRLAATRLRQRPMRWTVAILLLANGVLFWSLARDASAGTIDMGQAVTYAQAAIGASLIAFGGLNWSLPLAASSVAAVMRLDAAASMGRLDSGGKPAEGLPAVELRFNKVGFAYPAGTGPVLDGLDLVIPAGTSLGVVGLNGAGKTTLVKLLCRLYDPASGTIEVDGTDLRDLDIESWRRRITAVFQDFVRYDLPLRDNIAPLGAPDKLIEEALTAAGGDGLADLDQVLARGYDDGTDLSGGQWQRIALARALCAVSQGAGVVILDEPTAQLDVRGEAEIFDRVLRATRGRTTVLISHRFSTVRHADRICVLEHGRVVEQGTHDELMAAGGRYRHMFDLQASRFELEQTDGVPAL